MVKGNWSQEEKTNLLVHGVKAKSCYLIKKQIHVEPLCTHPLEFYNKHKSSMSLFDKKYYIVPVQDMSKGNHSKAIIWILDREKWIREWNRNLCFNALTDSQHNSLTTSHKPSSYTEASRSSLPEYKWYIEVAGEFSWPIMAERLLTSCRGINFTD